MSTMTIEITGVSTVCPAVCSAQIKENIKALRDWPLWGEFTGDSFISQLIANAYTLFEILCCSIAYCIYTRLFPFVIYRFCADFSDPFD